MPRTQTIEQAGDKIRELRIKAGLNTTQFAKRIKCDPDYVSGFETGLKDRIGEALFNRICRVLGVKDKDSLKRGAGA